MPTLHPDFLPYLVNAAHSTSIGQCTYYNQALQVLCPNVARISPVHWLNPTTVRLPLVCPQNVSDEQFNQITRVLWDAAPRVMINSTGIGIPHRSEQYHVIASEPDRGDQMWMMGISQDVFMEVWTHNLRASPTPDGTIFTLPNLLTNIFYTGTASRAIANPNFSWERQEIVCTLDYLSTEFYFQVRQNARRPYQSQNTQQLDQRVAIAGLVQDIAKHNPHDLDIQNLHKLVCNVAETR